MQLTVTNTLNRTVKVNGIRFYTTYGVPAFSASEQNFSIPASSAYNIWIKFSPRHNIQHNSEMVIVNDGLRGYTEVDLTGQGKYSDTYYNQSENTSEEALKTALHNLTGTGYVSLGYNAARDSMFMTIDNKKFNGQGSAQNRIECIYTGREAVGYTDRSDCQTNFSFNTEHTFPQTFFNSLEPMKSDLHHLFPTDDLANNYRADNPYAIITGGTIWSVGGSKATNSVFEPRDEQKGAAARAMMYFVLRYQNYSGFFTSQENLLRSWHHDFPPTAVDVKRNDDISLIQHNRNPFIDYPQFIERITSLSSTSVAPVAKFIDLTQDTIIYGYVPLSTPVVFHYVIVNTGNTSVQLSDFTLSQPELTFQSGGNDVTLAAGESHVLNIALVTQNNNPLHAFLNFNTDAPSHLTVSIPIYANDSVFNSIDEPVTGGIMIYPVPANDQMVVEAGGLEINSVSVMNLQGMTILEKSGSISPQLSIDLSMLAPGIYFLKVTGKEKIFFRKFVKE